MVRGGGETTRRTVIAFALPFITALMLVQPVSATDVIDDEPYDTPAWSWNSDGSPFTNLQNSNPPMVQVGYFDMIAYSLSLEGDHYRFWMKVLVDLPVEGDAIPSGIVTGEWMMYIDPGPFNPTTNPVVPLFLFRLVYDGSTYSAYMSGGGTEAPLGSFGHSGSELWIEFPTSVVDGLDLNELWWEAATWVRWGSSDWSLRYVDFSDWDPVLEAYSIPWPV